MRYIKFLEDYKEYKKGDIIPNIFRKMFVNDTKYYKDLDNDTVIIGEIFLFLSASEFRKLQINKL